MQDRKEEISTEWGKKGLAWGTGLGMLTGASSYVSQKIAHWEGDSREFSGRYTTKGGIIYVSADIAKLRHFALPLVTTAAFVGGLGYVGGKIYKQLYHPVKEPESAPKRQEKWADNGLKIGAGAGLVVSGLFALDQTGHAPFSAVLKSSVKTPISYALFCAGFGLFAATTCDKIKENDPLKIYSSSKKGR